MVPAVAAAGISSAPPRPAAGGALVVQTAFLGDTILTLPLIMRLAEIHDAVDVLTTPAALPLVASHPAVRRAIAFDKRGVDRGFTGLLRVARGLRRSHYAAAYLAHGSLRSAIVTWLAGIPQRHGFQSAAGSLLYTDAYRVGTGPMAARLTALAGNVNVPLPPAPWMVPSEQDQRRAGEWLSEHQVPPRFLVLAPGARWGTKRWPGYADLAAALPDPIVVLGGSEDTDLGRAILERAPGRSWNAAGALPLATSAALLSRATALVTNDSAPLHLATALGVPVVALFGPTVPAFGFGPVWPGDQVVEHPALPCRPCHHHGPMRCPLTHHRCMRELTVERVVDAVKAVGGRR